MFNTSLLNGVVPESWKHATIIPLKKCGNSTDVNNLGSILLLPLQGKLLEKIVHRRVLMHVETLDILDPNQGGFGPNHSTIDTITKFSDRIYQQINKGEIVVATYIDFKKAFDTVNHKILLKKLDKIGIRNKNLAWIQNYLTGRTQSTLANGIMSNKNLITCGVPQGSVLGPLLFLIYINDLGNSLRYSEHLLYADDTVIFNSGTSIHDILPNLQRDLTSFGKWCSSDKLTINTKKSNYVIYGTNQRVAKVRHCELHLQHDVLSRTPSYKYLGVYIDSHLNFNVHIDNCCKIVSHKLYLLSKIRHFITENASIQVYKSMIVPLLDYGDNIYAGTSDSNLSKLPKLQNRGLRICVNNQRHITRVQLHLACSISPMKSRRKTNLLKYMFKQQENENIVVNRDTARSHNIMYPKEEVVFVSTSKIQFHSQRWLTNIIN